MARKPTGRPPGRPRKSPAPAGYTPTQGPVGPDVDPEEAKDLLQETARQAEEGFLHAEDDPHDANLGAGGVEVIAEQAIMNHAVQTLQKEIKALEDTDLAVPALPASATQAVAEAKAEGELEEYHQKFKGKLGSGIKLSESQMQQIKVLYFHGVSYREIVIRLGLKCTVTELSFWSSRNGLPELRRQISLQSERVIAEKKASYRLIAQNSAMERVLVGMDIIKKLPRPRNMADAHKLMQVESLWWERAKSVLGLGEQQQSNLTINIDWAHHDKALQVNVSAAEDPKARGIQSCQINVTPVPTGEPKPVEGPVIDVPSTPST